MAVPIEEVLGYSFQDESLLQEALTHKSHAFEQNARKHNERLEFLGDSVLAIVVAHHLFERYSDKDEGHLSKLKAGLVSRTTLAEWAKNIGLGEFLHLGSGEESTGGRTRVSNLSNALEAVIGAVYLDGGYEEAYRFLHRLFLDQRAKVLVTDFKSELQEWVQKEHKVPPSYVLVDTHGPDHDKTFTVKVKLGSRTMGIGSGKTKKEAEQDAAQEALRIRSRSSETGKQ